MIGRSQATVAILTAGCAAAFLVAGVETADAQYYGPRYRAQPRYYYPPPRQQFRPPGVWNPGYQRPPGVYRYRQPYPGQWSPRYTPYR